MFIRNIGLILCLSFFTLSAMAWDATGHRIIAKIAYSRLTPEARAKIDALSEAFLAYGTPLSRFEYMAIEPDILKAEGDRSFASDHFINLPYSLEGTQPTEKMTDQNVVNAIKLAEKKAVNTQLSMKEQAQWLSYLVHFVGDAHQPLHCIVMYSKNFPIGDRGGVLYPIHYYRDKGLHELWDRGVDGFRLPHQHYPLSTEAVTQVAAAIVKQYPPSYFGSQLKDMAPHDWAMESYVDAKNFAYQVPMNTHPTKFYLKTNSQIARQRVALAGYRLAQVLNRIY